jgi:hypothetical protein
MATKPQIQYKTISHLFWGQYSHKVVVGIKTTMNRSYSKATVGISAKRAKEELAVLRYCPADQTLWKSASHVSTLVIFFKNKEDVEHLISNVKEQVLEVWQPVSDDQIKQLNDDHKIVFRDKLFYGTYDWCITCHLLSTEVRRDLKDWAFEYFDLGEQLTSPRILLSDGRHIKFYLSDESDVLMVKIAQSDRIRKIEKVVLTNTLITEEQ